MMTIVSIDNTINNIFIIYCITIIFVFRVTGELLFLNEATFLENLKTRYFKDKIYVSMI